MKLENNIENTAGSDCPAASCSASFAIAERMREARQYPAALPALPAQTDYERGFTDGHETGYQAGLRKAAEWREHHGVALFEKWMDHQ